MKILTPSSEFGEEARNIVSNFNNPRKGSDAGDHPPITPMKLANRNEFDNDTWRIYDYICRHFLATVSKDMKYRATTTRFNIGGEIFTNTSNELINAGYTAVMTWQAFGKNETSTPYAAKDMVHINDIKLVESQTGPPS